MTDATAEKILEGQAVILTETAGLKAEVKGMRALLSSEFAQAQRERTALFDSKKDHEVRINKVERDYLPRKALERHETDQRADFGRLTGQVDKIQVAVTRVMAIGGAVFVVAQLLMKWAGQ